MKSPVAKNTPTLNSVSDFELRKTLRILDSKLKLFIHASCKISNTKTLVPWATIKEVFIRQ